MELVALATSYDNQRPNQAKSRTHMKSRILFASAMILALTGAAFAQAKTFKVGAGNATQQLAQVQSDTEFEAFSGRTDKVTGTISFDPTKRTGSATIKVDVASIDTGIALRNDHMKDKGWLDAAAHPAITFVTTRIQHVSGDRYRVTGKFTMKGVTKTITVNATVKHIKESKATQDARFKGDVLQVRTSFDIKLKDYNVTIPAQAKGKVAETVKISLTVYGQTGA